MSPEFLDDLEHVRQLDRSKMAELIGRLPAQFTEILPIVRSVAWPKWKAEDFSGIAFLGMGGSAIGGDLVRGVLAETLPVPMTVVRNYRLPAWVSARTLVIASSYSGNTEETLHAVAEAQTRGCWIAALCSGGELARLAANHGWPRVALPGGMPPRTALGYSFGAVYLTLAAFGIVNDPSRSFGRLTEFLVERNARLEPAAPYTTNQAKRLATAIHGKTAVVYGAAGPLAVAALRWKGQLCENAKHFAFAGELPEFSHNEIVGWGEPGEGRERALAVFLRSADDHSRVVSTMNTVCELLRQQGVETEVVDAVGNDPLQRVFSLVQLGDWTSFFVAMLNGVDPTPIKAIDALKRLMHG